MLEKKIIWQTNKNTDKSKCSCNKKVLEHFGITTQEVLPINDATSAEKSICRRNQYTCCSAEQIQEIADTFQKGKQEFLKKMEVIEELLTLFVGEAYKRVFDVLPKKESTLPKQCSENFKESGFKGTYKQFLDILDNNFRKDRLNNYNDQDNVSVIEKKEGVSKETLKESPDKSKEQVKVDTDAKEEDLNQGREQDKLNNIDQLRNILTDL